MTNVFIDWEAIGGHVDEVLTAGVTAEVALHPLLYRVQGTGGRQGHVGLT